MTIRVSHFVGLRGIGGVQRNFVEYINNQVESDGELLHKIYTLGDVDSQYKISSEIYDIRSLKNLFSLILDITSRSRIVHFYNNITSLKLVILLFLLPVCNLVLHERGSIWNFPYSRGVLLRLVAWKAQLILANSNATKIMLEEKFYISHEKIRVIHNGINIVKFTKKKLPCDNFSPFHIGFIGRLDTPKGVHVLIDAMSYLVSDNIKLTIAGDGALNSDLRLQARPFKKISFIGRIVEPYSFLRNIDLLVVPSIREPLGNVCLEAGLCRVPVLAANIDGLPEIIENRVSGELMDATDEVSINIPESALPLPEFVVNSDKRRLGAPKQINPLLLSEKILELSFERDKLKYYADELHNKVVTYFNMERYRKELDVIYYEIKQKKTSNKRTGR
jgi:glycosyltransferase involved in cell wall biosynthesis